MNTRISIFLLLVSVLFFGCKARKTNTVNNLKFQSWTSSMVPDVWQAVGPFGSPIPMAEKDEWSAHGTGRFECVDVHPDNANEILMGHATSGLFKTIDGGKTWQQKLQFEFATGIFDILRFRKNSDHLIACCATDVKMFGYGLIESFDGGETWQRNSLQYQPVEYNLKQQRGIAIADKRNEQRLISISNHDIYVSKDGAKTWTIAYTTKENLKTVKVDPNNDKTIIITGSVLLVSTDGGETWQDKTPALCTSYGTVPSIHARYEVCFSKKYNNRLWVAVSHNSTYMLQVEVPGFNEFKLISKSQFTGNVYHMALDVLYNRKQNTEQLLVASTRLFKSNNDGVSFKQITSPVNGALDYAHDDVNGIAIEENGNIFITTDGGADVSKDEGVTWQSITNSSLDLNGSLLFGFDISAKGMIMTGTQDKGIFIYKNDTWFSANMYGDGGRVVAVNDSNGFACGYQKMCYRTTDGGKNFVYDHAGGDINFFDFRMDYSAETHTLFIANQHLYKQKDGKNFEILSNDIPAERPIGALWVNHENNDEIWLGKVDATWGGPLEKKLYYTDDGGLNWQDRSAALPILKWREISDIKVNTMGDVAVSFSGFDSEKGELNKVFISTDGGNSFENMSDGLGNYPVYALEAVGNRWVCGTANGVFVKKRGEPWQKLGEGFPATIVSELKFFEKERLLVVSTFGRGMWRILMD